MAFNAHAHRYSMGRACSKCAVPIGNTNASGLCRPCVLAKNSTDPVFLENRRQGLRNKIANDPEYAEGLRRRMKRTAQKAALDPVLTAKRRARGRYLYETRLNTPEVKAKILASRRAVGDKLREQRMAWCPPELRAKYKALYRNKRIPSAVARVMIEAEAADLLAVRSPGFRDAIYWLNRIAPVTLQEDGTYRYGNAFLSPAEVISRAKAKGWQEAMAA